VELILASASPRRRELLSKAGFTFACDPVDVDERVRRGERPVAYVRRLARAKARAAALRHPCAVVVGADTAVILRGHILGKPEDAADAARMLGLLSGRWHEVLTGVAVARDRRLLDAVASTRVLFATLSREEIEWYVSSGEPGDKAGAYGIQGLAARFVERVDGSCSNVVGLPVAEVYRLLSRLDEAGSLRGLRASSPEP